MSDPTRVESAAPTSRSYNRWLGRARLVLLFAALILLLAWSEPTPFSVSFGFIFIFVGESIRFWAAGHLHKTTRLITSGPYRYTRNPLYLGRLLIFTGFALMTRLPWSLHLAVLALGYAIFFIYYLPRKERVEPARLRALHGARYQRYFSAVPSLFPRRSPWPHAERDGWYSSRMLRNREHWMVIGLALATILLLVRAYR